VGSCQERIAPIHGKLSAIDEPEVKVMDELPETKPESMSQDEWNVVVAVRHTRHDNRLGVPRNWKEYCRKLEYCLFLADV